MLDILFPKFLTTLRSTAVHTFVGEPCLTISLEYRSQNEIAGAKAVTVLGYY
jgi:hypothetical protein